jgi:enoyl-CoA hydratase/carnithine racemase
MSETNLLLTDLKEGVFTITLNRPKVNAFNFELIAALQSAFKQAERDDQVRCVVLTGAGDAFSAGQDVTERRIRPRDHYGAVHAEVLFCHRCGITPKVLKSFALMQIGFVLFQRMSMIRGSGRILFGCGRRIRLFWPIRRIVCYWDG